MYEKSNRLCPSCYRWLRIDRTKTIYFCPDTLRCRLRKAVTRPPKRVTLEMVQEQLKTERSRPKNKQDPKLIARLKDALVRWI